MAQGTPLIFPVNIGWNNNGSLSAGAIATFYLAGTVTLVNIYADVALSVPLANPLTADGNGRFPEIFATPGVSYKIKLTDANGVALSGYPADNVPAVPTSSSNQEVQGTAGETLTSGSAVYLSDGSGSKTAGSWYKGDSANPYSSTLNEVGMVPSTIASGSTGTIRTGGSIGSLTVTIGQLYYIGTAGAITTTAPANARVIGQADTTTSLVLGAPATVPVIDNTIVDGRLTLTTAVPVTTGNVTAATTVYFTPYKGNRIALYNGTSWAVQTFAELSIAVPATTATMYDVFAFNNSGAVALEVLAWTNDTTRATALVTQDGVLSKTGVLTRRWLGSFRTTGVSGQTEDSASNRLLANYYNRLRRPLLKQSADVSWTYATATVRQANGSTANQVSMVSGFQESLLDLSLVVHAEANATITAVVGFGEGTIATPVTNALLSTAIAGSIAADASGVVNGGQAAARLTKYAPLGATTYTWLEWVSGATFTFYGVPATPSGPSGSSNGIGGWIEG